MFFSVTRCRKRYWPFLARKQNEDVYVDLCVKHCFADVISKASQSKWKVPQESSKDS